MQRKVYLLGSASLETAESGSASGESVTISYESLSIQLEGVGEALSELTGTEDFLGSVLGPGTSPGVLASCQDLSPTAHACGVVDVAVLHGERRLYGDCALVPAIAELLKQEGVAVVRTALIIGGGDMARMAVLALKELGCARYVIGYEDPAQLAQLEAQFRAVRKIISWFPLAEMADFFGWAEQAEAFVSQHVPPTETGGAERGLDKGAKRWELVVNTLPDSGLFTADTPVANHNFLSTVNRVLDLTSSGEPTELIRLARKLGIPAFSADRLPQLHSAQIHRILQRALAGEPLTPAAEPRRDRQRYVMRRRRRKPS